MKFKFIALSALAAAVAFVSCNQDNTDVLPANAQKSVSITILNQSQTRAAVDTLTDGSIDGTDVIDAKKLNIVFADGDGDILTITGLPTTLAQAELSLGTGANIGVDTFTFHHLPREVEQIALTNLEVSESTTTLPLLKASRDLDEDLGWNEFPIWGEDVLEFAEGQHTETIGGETVVTDLYTAEIEVNSLWARFEIQNIQCDDLNTDTVRFSSLTLNAIGLVYGDGTLAAAGENFSDDFPAEITLTSKDDIYQVGTGEEEALPGIFAFNVDTLASTSAVPSIHLSVDATRRIGGATETGLFVKTKSLGDAITKIEPGSIYVVNYKFKDENVKKDGEDPTLICVDVVVTVKKWSVITAAPVFE